MRAPSTGDSWNGDSLASTSTGPAAAAPTEPLTAGLHNTPQPEEDTGAFTFEPWFSEQVKPSYHTLQDPSPTGGPSRWLIAIVSDSNADVAAVLPATENCDDESTMSTQTGRSLGT
ncbi:MAG: hypothetical protein OXG37_00690 [Actinomycetia bacterium]|nr:hypothetical protein [Actinomycetes bacterium]